MPYISSAILAFTSNMLKVVMLAGTSQKTNIRKYGIFISLSHITKHEMCSNSQTDGQP